MKTMHASRWFTQELRVRYQETDQMGVVYYANYLNWFEIGRTELIRELGMTYREIEEAGLFLPVVEADVKFQLPAKYDDIIRIYSRIAEFSSIRLRFECQIRRTGQAGVFPEGTESIVSSSAMSTAEEPEGEFLVGGSTRHVWLNKDWRPVRIDRQAPALYNLIGTACGINA